MDINSLSPITQLTPAQLAPPVEQVTRRANDDGFASALADAVSRDARLNATAVSGGMNASEAVPGGDMSALLLASAVDGGASEKQLALFMLMQMMQGISSSASGADAIYLSAISAALAESFTGSRSAGEPIINAVGYDSEFLRTPSEAAAAAPYIPAASISSAFSASGARAVLPTAEWVPASPVYTNMPSERSPENYIAAVAQFDVTQAPRYAPGRNGHTYCNIFVWDVTRALGCEVPHYIDPASGAPMEYPDTAGASELNALSMGRWLASTGKSYGWVEVSPEQAQLQANRGRPAVAVSSAVSHISMVVPSRTDYDPRLGVAVAQAGSVVTNYSYLGNIYSDAGMKSVRYFVHE
ncbi:MAG: hypothetical protein LBH17_06490 [Oscillospiraceae bacterium]|jgi:hypothetical protein|nr:hypothetical protein [Oscillospiraceae bacterium]